MAVAGDVLERARELRLAGLAHNSAGRPHRAERSLHAALGLLPPVGAPADAEADAVRVSCLLTLAMAELFTTGIASAQRRLDQAQALAGDRPDLLARCRCQRGTVRLRAGDLGGAADDLAAVAREPHWFTAAEQAAIEVNLGVIAFELGRPAEAERHYAAAAGLAREAGNDQLRYMAEYNRGYTRYLTGDLPGALAAMAAAEASPADVFRGTSLLALARVYGEAGLLDQAIGTLDRAEDLCRPRVDRILRAEIDRERAVLLRLAGEPDAAATAARAARTRFARLGMAGPAAVASLLVLDGDLARGRRLPAVLAGAREVEAVARRLGDGDLVARSLAVEAEAACRLGRAAEASAALARYPGQAHGLVVHLRHVYAAAVTDLASGRSPRRRLARAASDLAASQAVSASLDSRAARKVLGLRLTELDLGLAIRRGPGDVLATLERWTSLGLPVVRPPADPRQADLTERLRALSQALRDDPDGPRAAGRRAETARLRRELTELGLAQRQHGEGSSSLPTLADALDLLAGADRDLLWLFPADGALWGVAVVAGRRRLERLAELGPCLEMTRRLRADLRALASAPPGPLRDAIAVSLAGGLARLDDAVIRPWRLRSAGLVVVGTHAVASVPWGMLPSLAGVPVTVARAASEWAVRRGPTAAPGVRVLRGPGLRHAAAEAAEVATAWGCDGPSGDARAAELLEALAGADLVHVAAHGRHQPASPLFSSLRMADGDVFAHELPTGRVRAGHVVLSACEVGTAEVRPGDEPLGLAHTLLALGVGSVVAAVAPVPDDTTAPVMSAYHAGLARGLPSDEALAGAAAGTAFVVLGSPWRTDASAG